MKLLNAAALIVPLITTLSCAERHHQEGLKTSAVETDAGNQAETTEEKNMTQV